MRRRGMFKLLARAALGFGAAKSLDAQPQPAHDYVDWVREVLQRMQTIVPGMTREMLYQVFTTEGGLSTGLQRTFVSRDCPYFKVDVQFQPIGRSDRDGNGRVTLVEDNRDIVLKISTPYLQFSIMD